MFSWMRMEDCCTGLRVQHKPREDESRREGSRTKRLKVRNLGLEESAGVHRRWRGR